MAHDDKELGIKGEEAAAAFLERVGMTIEARNWTCKQGEADIVARDGDALVFVEVKTRRGVEHGTPEDAVTAAKQKRYAKLAKAYLATLEEPEVEVRFDVVTILDLGEGHAILRHHRAAFTVE